MVAVGVVVAVVVAVGVAVGVGVVVAVGVAVGVVVVVGVGVAVGVAVGVVVVVVVAVGVGVAVAMNSEDKYPVIKFRCNWEQKNKFHDCELQDYLRKAVDDYDVKQYKPIPKKQRKTK